MVILFAVVMPSQGIVASRRVIVNSAVARSNLTAGSLFQMAAGASNTAAKRSPRVLTPSSEKPKRSMMAA